MKDEKETVVVAPIVEAPKTEDVVIVPAVEADPITVANEKIAKIEKDRDNYKDVALRRLGKLPGDAAFLSSDLSELPVADQIRLALLDKEKEQLEKQKEDSYNKMARERDEAILALKNRPQSTIGTNSNAASVEVKDNVLNDSQIADLTARAKRLNADPVKFIEAYKSKLVAQG